MVKLCQLIRLTWCLIPYGPGNPRLFSHKSLRDHVSPRTPSLCRGLEGLRVAPMDDFMLWLTALSLAYRRRKKTRSAS